MARYRVVSNIDYYNLAISNDQSLDLAWAVLTTKVFTGKLQSPVVKRVRPPVKGSLALHQT
jgi:hypothetical protein